ncbi:MAG: phosphotransferase [Lachnospiraceae bacterium]|nr:phosphotransferase [Lachnospiraceae bacterium]
MIFLTKENLTDYLKEHMDELDYSKPLSISAVGEGSEEEDGDGYLNFIFRVSDGKRNIIVKQGRTIGRNEGFKDLSSERTRLEFESMAIRKAIVPEYIPDLYFYDDENQVFVTEDVSYLKIMRFQLNKSIMFPGFDKLAADFLSKIHFYTSELFLDTEEFRELDNHFTNHKMRSIFDRIVFVSKDEFGQKDYGLSLDPEVADCVRDIVFDPASILERYRLRKIFMKTSEALIHCDYHTSNIFIGDGQMKVIDMEYCFCGPVAFDLGYLFGNLISQYVCAGFRTYEREEDRQIFRDYIMDTIAGIYVEYRKLVCQYWDRDAKEEYKGVEGLQEAFFKYLLSCTIGFCSTANLFRIASEIDFPEYSAIKDRSQMRQAVTLSAFMDRRMLLNRDNYQDIREWLEDMKQFERVCRVILKEMAETKAG